MTLMKRKEKQEQSERELKRKLAEQLLQQERDSKEAERKKDLDLIELKKKLHEMNESGSRSLPRDCKTRNWTPRSKLVERNLIDKKQKKNMPKLYRKSNFNKSKIWPQSEKISALNRSGKFWHSTNSLSKS